MSIQEGILFILLSLSGLAHILSYLTLKKKQQEIERLTTELTIKTLERVKQIVKNVKKTR